MPSNALEVQASRKVCNLDGLAKRIDTAHVAAQAAIQAGAQKAIEAGQLLLQAKTQVPHGQWETWVTQNTAVSPRTARAYQQVARHWAKADEAKRQRVAVLGLRTALTEMANPVPLALPSRCAQSDDATDIVASGEEVPRTVCIDPSLEGKKAAWIEADLEILGRRYTRIRAKFEGRIQEARERQIDNAVLSSTEANILAACRLLGSTDLEKLARVSRLDEMVNLEELACLFTDAASRALELQKPRPAKDAH